MTDDRYPSDETVRSYLDQMDPVIRPIYGTPAARLSIDASRELLSLEVAWDGVPARNVDMYDHFFTGVVVRSGTDWSVLSIRGADLLLEGYPILRAVADGVQINGESFNYAVSAALARHRQLLSVSGFMSVEREIGLLGELLVLISIAGNSDGLTAVDSWRGGDMTEEHDFGFLADDIEVKTTSTERRTHRIGSLDQLRGNPGRRLWLASIQVTRGGQSGSTLPDIIARAIEAVGDDQQLRLLDRLEKAGYRKEQPHHNFSRWIMRAEPALYSVDDVGFPRLTREALQNASVSPEVVAVGYEIDLTNIAASHEGPRYLGNIGGAII